MKTPKPFQLDAINNAYRGLKQRGTQFINGPVGSGKTLIGIQLARRWVAKDPRRKVILAVPRVTMSQWCEEAQDQGAVAAKYYGTGRDQTTLHEPLSITTIATLHASIRTGILDVTSLGKRTLLVIDEIDQQRNMMKHTLDETRKSGKSFCTIGVFIQQVLSSKGAVLGLTATPIRDSHSDMLFCAWIADQSPKSSVDVNMWLSKKEKDDTFEQKEFVRNFWCNVDAPRYAPFEFVERTVRWRIAEVLAYRSVSEKLQSSYQRLLWHMASRSKHKTQSSVWREKLHILQETYYRYAVQLERTLLHPLFATQKGKLDAECIRGAATSPSSRMVAVSEDLKKESFLQHRVLILGKFTEPLKILKSHLTTATPRQCFEHYGEHTTSQRESALRRFRNTSDGIFVATWDSFGVGLSLPEANVVYWFNTPKSPGIMQQGNGRVRRPLVQTLHKWRCVYFNSGDESYDAYILAQHSNRVADLDQYDAGICGDMGCMARNLEPISIWMIGRGSVLPGEGAMRSSGDTEANERTLMYSEDVRSLN